MFWQEILQKIRHISRAPTELGNTEALPAAINIKKLFFQLSTTAQ